MKTENEFRVIGPPGTGKTTYLAKQVAKAVEKNRRPLITSLTRAAAVEISQRVDYTFEFSESQVGTLHAHCFRALGSPAMIAKQEHLDDWNKYCKRPEWDMSPSAFVNNRDGEGMQKAGIGDGLYNTYTLLRAKMVPDSLWPAEAMAFAHKFREWKNLSSLFDFTDLIETALRDVDVAPHDPDVIFVDEAQDHDRMELALVRKWAKSADMLIVCGDPDQNLFEFRGAEPEAFYSHPIPDEHYITLSQSYRVPRAVHARAMAMIEQIEGRRQVEYLPRDFDGDVRKLWVKIREAHKICAEAAMIAETGRTVMILATCEYMLGGIIKYLRETGIPFHNPYAPTRGQFNPLGDRGGVTSPQRLMSFLRASETHYGEDARRWTWKEFDAWIDPITVDGFLRRGSKKKVEQLAQTRGDAMVDGKEFGELLDPAGGAEHLDLIERNPLAWYRDRLNKSRSEAFRFPFAVIERRGVAALKETPKIILGTIHSVKGGQADVVFISPDVSPEGCESLAKNPASIYRAFYVGLTRAREEVRLLQNSSSMALAW